MIWSMFRHGVDVKSNPTILMRAANVWAFERDGAFSCAPKRILFTHSFIAICARTFHDNGQESHKRIKWNTVKCLCYFGKRTALFSLFIWNIQSPPISTEENLEFIAFLCSFFIYGGRMNIKAMKKTRQQMAHAAKWLVYNIISDAGKRGETYTRKHSHHSITIHHSVC